MAGHSKYANTKHRKAAQDNKKSKVCTKLMREIVVASRQGIPDPELNGRLKIAIYNARREGLAKDRIDLALKNASGQVEGEDYEEMLYEAYASSGVAMMIHSLTNNKNRTASDLRYILSKRGGNLGEDGSVRFLFINSGVIVYENSDYFSNLLEIAIEVGANDVKEDDGKVFFYTEKSDLGSVRDSLSIRFGNPIEARLTWLPLSYVYLDVDQKAKVADIIEELNDNDDVQHIETNIKWD